VGCGIYLGMKILRKSDSHAEDAEKRRLQVCQNHGERYAHKAGCALREWSGLGIPMAIDKALLLVQGPRQCPVADSPDQGGAVSLRRGVHTSPSQRNTMRPAVLDVSDRRTFKLQSYGEALFEGAANGADLNKAEATMKCLNGSRSSPIDRWALLCRPPW